MATPTSPSANAAYVPVYGELTPETRARLDEILAGGVTDEELDAAYRAMDSVRFAENVVRGAQLSDDAIQRVNQAYFLAKAVHRGWLNERLQGAIDQADPALAARALVSGTSRGGLGDVLRAMGPDRIAQLTSVLDSGGLGRLAAHVAYEAPTLPLRQSSIDALRAVTGGELRRVFGQRYPTN